MPLLQTTPRIIHLLTKTQKNCYELSTSKQTKHKSGLGEKSPKPISKNQIKTTNLQPTLVWSTPTT
ncbi:hypothetical protein Hanom_Chr11g01004671 [Helianthus anomalus]